MLSLNAYTTVLVHVTLLLLKSTLVLLYLVPLL